MAHIEERRQSSGKTMYRVKVRLKGNWGRPLPLAFLRMMGQRIILTSTSSMLSLLRPQPDAGAGRCFLGSLKEFDIKHFGFWLLAEHYFVFQT